MYGEPIPTLGWLGLGRIAAAILLVMLLLPWLMDALMAGELVPLEGQHVFALLGLALLTGLRLWESRVERQLRRLQQGR